MRRILFLILCLTCTAHATIYQSTDKNGSIVFSNTPSHNSKPVQLEKLQTYRNADKQPPTTSNKKLKTPNHTYKSIEFTNLNNNATIRNNNSTSFTVQLSIKPALRKSDRAVLMLGGKPIGKAVIGPSEMLNFKLFNVTRGSHSLQVQILSSKTQQHLFQSNSITVNFQQNSVKFKKSN